MNFDSSTHKARWIFDKETLDAKRVEMRQKAVDNLKRSREHTPLEDDGSTPPDAKKQRAEAPVSTADEALLRRYFELSIRQVCEAYPLPPKVQATAIAYFKRFYTQRSCLEHDPARIMPTCIYLAAKVEESYISAEDFCKKLNKEPQAVLRTEVPVLQALGFDLVVHSPYRALGGLMQELEDLRSQRSSALDLSLVDAPPDTIQKLQRGAHKAVAAVLQSDAPLLFPPGVLALAALRSGARSAGLPCTQFLEHAARRAAEARRHEQQQALDGGQRQEAGIPGGVNVPPAHLQVPAADSGLALQQLLGWMGEVDALVVAAMKEEEGLDQKATEVDRAIKLWKKAQ